MPAPIKHFLNALLPAQQSWKLTLLQQWHTIMGNLKTHVTLEKINDDTLTLGVFNSSWMQELYLISPIILETINKNLDQPRIKQIRFKQIVQKKKKKIMNNAPSNLKEIDISLTVNEKNALATIQDPELRQSLYKFLVRCQREK
ncbi:MAG: hypothetical protein BWY54_00748 [Candidatus Dependentiae bacterium ADurb.Bin331]|nr:MAG: hypothetical protein BWY54_00748 [Candidatus Dependentiae bacterium ADurb.Bin331]